MKEKISIPLKFVSGLKESLRNRKRIRTRGEVGCSELCDLIPICDLGMSLI